MRSGIKIALTLRDRKALEALIANRNTPSKVVWRAQIILATAEGCGTNEIIRRSGKSKTCVWRWQERFMSEAWMVCSGTKGGRRGSPARE